MNKYNARPVVIDNIKFASAREGKRYIELKLLFRARKITCLQLQPDFKIEINGKKICTYRADFSYFDGDQQVIEDVKGVRTPAYRLKKKMVEASYGIEIREV